MNYILEHDYRWLTGDKVEHDFWSPPVFYPQHDTAAYTELMLGVLPFYGVWRLFGVDPWTALQLWVITVSALNLISAYWLLNHELGCGWTGACAGAVLFAFGSPRLCRIASLQLWPAFYMVMAFAGLCLLMRDSGSLTSRRVYTGLTMFAGGFCAQLYSCFYYAWFMAFTVALGLVFALVMQDSRSRLWMFLRSWWRALPGAVILAALILAPYGMAAWKVFRQLGGRSYSEAERYLPMAKAWLAPGGPNHLLYGGWNRFVGLGPGPSSTELFNGIGLLTSALVIAGLVLFRDRAVVRLWGLVSLSVMLLSYQWPGGYSLWRFVYACFPGATAIRAVSRLSVYLLLPASIVLASIVDRIGTRAASIAAIACMLAVGLEQAGTLQDVKDYSKAQLRARIAMVANAVRPECAAFLFSWGQLLFEQPLPRPPAVHILGMWAELATGVPTLNGYSGSIPPQWPLRDVRVTNDADRKRVLENVELWMQLHPHDFGNVCWVLPEPPGSMNVSLQVIQHLH